MKFLVVFVHEEDAPGVTLALRKEGFRFTVIESTSGFLGQESRTFLVGVQEEQVEECLEKIKRK